MHRVHKPVIAKSIAAAMRLSKGDGVTLPSVGPQPGTERIRTTRDETASSPARVLILHLTPIISSLSLSFSQGEPDGVDESSRVWTGAVIVSDCLCIAF